MSTTPRLRSGSRRRAALTLLVALTVSLAATACGSSSDATPTPTDPPAESTATTVDATYEAAIAAYQNFWTVYLKASNPPNPNDPDLAQVATGGELDTIRSAISQKVADRTFTRLPPDSKYRHQVVDHATGPSDRLTLIDCALDDAEIVRVSGEVINADVVTEKLQSTLINVDGVWKIESVQRLAQWPGEYPCVDSF